MIVTLFLIRRSVPVPRRHTPYFGQPDYRVYELNKRLQQRTEVSCRFVVVYPTNVVVHAAFRILQESDNLWWDAFATEFFEDDASLTLTFCLEDGPKRYSEFLTDTDRIDIYSANVRF